MNLVESGAILGDGLGALRDCVLGELTREQEANGGLDLSGGEGLLLVVPSEANGLVGQSVKRVVDERVHDHHCLLGDASLGVNLLKNLVDVRGEGLDVFAAVGLCALLLGGLGGL